MFVGNEDRLNAILENIAELLDVTPTDYERAVQSYQAVGQWLEEGYAKDMYHGSTAKPEIYPQGSIRLGTIVRPIKNGTEADYDVDLVCELQVGRIDSSPNNARAVKHQIGNCLKSNKIYAEKLDPEGRRCWTLDYVRQDGGGFHIDVLPCIPDEASASPYAETAIALTHRHSGAQPSYEWKSSNPNGYATWFESQNITFNELLPSQKQLILERAKNPKTLQPIYESVDKVPNQLVRTPLQRAIQIFKRHRDMRFISEERHKIKPISIIITTLAASLYQGEGNIYYTLKNILSKLGLYAELQKNQYITLHESIAGLGLISRRADGRWEIPNPANPDENFADRWHEDNHARARAFFEWVNMVTIDLTQALETGDIGKLQTVLEPSFGERAVSEALKTYNDQVSRNAVVKHVQPLPARFEVQHRQMPLWPVHRNFPVTIKGHISCDGQWHTFKSDSAPLPKHCSLRFSAECKIPPPFQVYWQVINTGREAAMQGASGLRGGIFSASTTGKGGLIHKESTLYTGSHCVLCYIVKNNICVARSNEFVVNIQ
ncbi:MAG: nucleotidyltransferase [Nitrospirae bacterium]|nr:MAG: nucleotidyltransferase [Nitrospirota bacterium]